MVIAAALPWIPVTASAARETADEPGRRRSSRLRSSWTASSCSGSVASRRSPAEERARLIAERIAAVAADPAVDPGSLRVVEADGRSEFFAGERRIAGVVDADAVVEDVSRPTLAAANLRRIRATIEAYRRDRTPDMLRSAAAQSAAAMVALVVASPRRLPLAPLQAVARSPPRATNRVDRGPLLRIRSSRAHFRHSSRGPGRPATITVFELGLAWLSYASRGSRGRAEQGTPSCECSRGRCWRWVPGFCRCYPIWFSSPF